MGSPMRRLELLTKHAVALRAASTAANAPLDVAVVGAGMAGLYALHLLRGHGMRVRVYERGNGVGGTWFWNRYPGAQCDVESLQYGFTFSQELHRDWSWTRKYSAQPEILEYVNHVADRFDLRKDVQLSSAVRGCRWDEAASVWELDVESSGVTEIVRARFVIMATGCLSERNWPQIPGLEEFKGRLWHTQDWPEQAPDFSNRRVGVIGTGSSGVQTMTQLASQVGQLVVFQRTPSFVIPAHNSEKLTARETEVKASFPEFAAGLRQTAAAQNVQPTKELFAEASPEVREATFSARWKVGGFPFLAAFADMGTEEANEAQAEFVRRKIRETVRNPAVAEALCPKYLLACKRVCVADGYYEIFNRDNISLVDLHAVGSIEKVTTKGLRVGSTEYLLDDLICATGFDAITGALAAVDICGRAGVSLRDEWQEGPQTYLGLAAAGFPNLFMVTGPQSPSVLTNMPLAIEQHVEWIAGCLRHLRETGKRTIEATAAAQDSWVTHCRAVSDVTLGGAHPSCGNSWYTGANIDGKPRIMLPYRGGFGQPAGLTPWPSYTARCAEVAAQGYEGFDIA